MRIAKSIFTALLMLALAGTSALADPAGAATTLDAPSTLDQVIDRIAQQEKELVAAMKKYHPMVETYLQQTRPDAELGSVPLADKYFLGRLYLTNNFEERFYTSQQEKVGWRQTLNPVKGVRHFFKMDFMPMGFAAMIVPDARGLDRSSYDFKFIRREFLGDVRCLVFQVTPKPKSGTGRFLGRIWVEDKEYNIVRFNGTYTQPPRGKSYFHMDSWRRNVQPGVWLPSEVYSEESEMKYGMITQSVSFKATTRLWAYDRRHGGHEEEFTQVLIDQPDTVKDESEPALDWSPIMSLRAWQREAEENILERLEQAALLAPRGPVDKVLETVVNNLQITNNLDIQPEVHCRVLLTSPLESFTVGHTIIVSRGLLDVLPDEASLAMVLSHELAHLALGEQLDTKYSFGDRMTFADQDTYSRLRFAKNAPAEQAADARALELLKNSPYADKLGSAGLFLRQLQQRSTSLASLVHPHLGNSLTSANGVRMAALMNGAPELQMQKVEQIAALPLGGRIKIDPWSDRIDMMKTKSLPLQSAREKMPLEIAPAIPHLTRLNLAESAVAQPASGK
jgi:hypothetical protein